MKIGIMQPYFFPYIGYWQLMNAVDKYVIYDDVTFIKNGWINRNRILINGQPSYFNLPIKGASSYTLIKDVQVNQDKKLFDKLLRTLQLSYSKAPYFTDVMPIIENIFDCQEESLSKFIYYSFKLIAEYLDIKTEFILSSTLEKNNELKAQDKVIHICKLLKATDYYNAIGGQELYNFEDFEKNNIKLCFVKTNEIVYKQFKNEFQLNLSIIDVLMFNSVEEVKNILMNFELIMKKKLG